MARITSPPPPENPNNGLPAHQPGTPNQQTGVPVSQFTQTGVPVSQFTPPNDHQAKVNLSIGSPWSTHLFDCDQDLTNAVMTVILPCVTFGQIAEVVDEGEMTCPLGGFIYVLMMSALCSHWVMGSMYRKKIRRKFNLVEAPYSDCVSHVICPCCSLCQEYRELKARSLNPSLGWNGILAERQGRQYVTEAPPNQYMSM